MGKCFHFEKNTYILFYQNCPMIISSLCMGIRAAVNLQLSFNNTGKSWENIERKTKFGKNTDLFL